MYFHDLTGTCAHLSYDNATVQLLEEALMESDQHVAKAAFLVEIEAVGSCCIFLGTWMLYGLKTIKSPYQRERMRRFFATIIRKFPLLHYLLGRIRSSSTKTEGSLSSF